MNNRSLWSNASSFLYGASLVLGTGFQRSKSADILATSDEHALERDCRQVLGDLAVSIEENC